MIFEGLAEELSHSAKPSVPSRNCVSPKLKEKAAHNLAVGGFVSWGFFKLYLQKSDEKCLVKMPLAHNLEFHVKFVEINIFT